MYVHRIGRTGRAGREGVAITLVEPREHRLLRDIERTIGAPLELVGLPTVADVREKRLEILRGDAARDARSADGFDRYRGGGRAAVGRVRPRRHRARRDQPRRRGGARRRGHRRARAGHAAAGLRSARAGRPRRARSAPEARRRPRCDAVGGAGSASTAAPRRRRRRTPAAAAAAAPSQASNAEATDARRDRRRPVPQGAAAPVRGYRVSGWRDADGDPLMRPPRRGTRERRRHPAVRRGGAGGGHAARRPGRRDHERGRALAAGTSARSRSPTGSRSSTCPPTPRIA